MTQTTLSEILNKINNLANDIYSIKLNQLLILDTLTLSTYRDYRRLPSPPLNPYVYPTSPYTQQHTFNQRPRTQSYRRPMYEQSSSSRTLLPNIELSFLESDIQSIPTLINSLLNDPLESNTTSSSLTSLRTIIENTEIINSDSLDLSTIDNCSICQNTIEPNTILRKINNCSHYFHINCIDNWLKDHTTCPICRQPINNANANTNANTNTKTENINLKLPEAPNSKLEYENISPIDKEISELEALMA